MFWTITKNLVNPLSFYRVGVLNYIYLIILAGYFFVLSKINPNLPKKYFFYKFKGSQILVDSNFSDIGTFIEIFAFNEYSELLKLLNTKETYNVIDLGANIGLFYRFLDLKKININNYLAIEPNPSNFQALNFNIYPRTSIFPKALWINNKGVKFSTTDFNNANSINPEGDTFVPTITLREVLDEIDNSNPTILKMDIEGAEYEVLKNSLDIIENIKIIFVEFHNVLSEKELISFINKYLKNYSFILEKKSNDMYLLTGKLI